MAGLLLLFISGMHILWAIYMALFFDKYKNIYSIWTAKRKHKHLHEIVIKDFGMLFSIASWYAGVMIGSAVVGFLILPQVRKKNVYVCVCMREVIRANISIKLLPIFRFSTSPRGS